MTSLSDPFTAEEIARASSVPREAVDAVIEAGEVRVIPGTPFFAPADAIRAGQRARHVAQRLAETKYRVEPGLFALTSRRAATLEQRRGFPTFAASFVHAALVILMIWAASRSTETAPVATASPSRLIFLALPGRGGGGGGGGVQMPQPAARLEHKAPRLARPVPTVTPDKVPLTSRQVEVTKPAAPRPEPVARPIEPLPARVLIAPVAASGRERERQGDIASDRTAGNVGAGTGGGAGTGHGLGNGSGTGAGIGPGTGGGTGGGPFRPGSGIDPPRLLREVKAVYTDDARRRGLTGDVVLEIVITRDGSVSDVSVTRGLGAGLDERAVAAVRQWRFSPARRNGEAVDVIVEVAVEFSLR